MTLRTGAMWFFVTAANVLAGCGSTPPAGPGMPGRTGGASGGSGGSGGSPSAGQSGTTAGSGGVAQPGGSGGSSGTGGSPGSGGATPSGTGGTTTAPDAGGGDSATPPVSGEQPLPACKKTTPVAATAELAGAITGAQPGDCLVLADGNYTFPVITKTGTAAEPIVIRAANRGKAVVNAGNIQFIKSDHVIVEGLDFTSPGAATQIDYGGSSGVMVGFSDSNNCRLTRTRLRPMNPPGERDWIVITGTSHHNRIDHNDLGPQTSVANMLVINGTGTEEPLVPGQVCQHNRVDHNYFHDITNGGGNNWEAIRVGRSWQGPTKGFNIIEFNLLKGASGDPETISVKSSDNTVRHNTMRATSGEICLRHGNRGQVYGNYILADGNGGSRGIRVYGADHRIFNNYIAGTSTGIWLDAGSASATEEPGKEHYAVYRAWVFNNTLVGPEIRVGGSKANAPKDCKIANNLVLGGLAAGGTGTVNEGNIVGGASPLTMSMSDGIGRLLANAEGARAIGKAVNASAYGLMDDIQGQPRAEPDVGADEASMAPVSIPGPLTPADVGPDAP